ncbi:MAG: helix-turn-helix transcriptional regulator [Clostridia bacterium]|nr:helix-turn-helix transcriptional regulator [Clostridia bacterium]
MDFGIAETNIDYQVIGERIRNARKKKGMTQERLAELIGVAVGYLSRVERGQSKVNLKRLSDISNALDISISEFITNIAPQNEQYLEKEFKKILDKCTSEQRKLIYNVAKIISEIKKEKN